MLESARRTAWFALLALVLALPGCHRSSPEQRLRESMLALQSAIEERDPTAMHEWLAEDFVGPDGLDREGARRLAQLMYLRYRDVDISLGPLQIELQQEHASVRFTAVLTGGPGGLLPERGQVYDVQTGWRLEGGEDWRLTSANWSSAMQ
jgi:hypothetical protein